MEQNMGFHSLRQISFGIQLGLLSHYLLIKTLDCVTNTVHVDPGVHGSSRINWSMLKLLGLTVVGVVGQNTLTTRFQSSGQLMELIAWWILLISLSVMWKATLKKSQTVKDLWKFLVGA
eukprot:TRINITY_DN6764_c0_g1_i2.p2 TRINITY_DN6764_c0_g1~~TRINITY_DN6764_c0_g1_i2.p2  ORF type:complete len:119 (-),score=30.01 TRINITY_DN6764_c0_g1_i2:68-424(-)